MKLNNVFRKEKINSKVRFNLWFKTKRFSRSKTSVKAVKFDYLSIPIVWEYACGWLNDKLFLWKLNMPDVSFPFVAWLDAYEQRFCGLKFDRWSLMVWRVVFVYLCSCFDVLSLSSSSFSFLLRRLKTGWVDLLSCCIIRDN